MPRLSRFIITAVLGWAALSLPGAERSSGRQPNVVVILADDLRPDTFGYAGHALVRTPEIDRLANRGAVFTRATCSYPICWVSRSEMFSGRPLLGAGRGSVKFDPAWTLWPEQMKRAGWHTVYSGKWHVTGSPAAAGFVKTAGLYSAGGAAGMPVTVAVTPTGREVTGYRGWTFKNEKGQPLPELGVGLTPETDVIITDRAVEFLRRSGAQPFFLQVNFTAPHDPLLWPPGKDVKREHRDIALPANFRPEHPFDTGNISGRDETIVPAPRSAEDVQKEWAIYLRQVEHIDRQVGRIVRVLEETGQLAQTIIVVTSDHGLALGSHGLMGKQNQYEHTMNVPLVLAGPGIPTGKRFAAQCYLRDLYPTICDLTGVPVPVSVQALSLVPVLRGERAEVRDAIFGYFTDTQRMMRDAAGWKLIWYPAQQKYQLFNVTADPDELRDLAGEPAEQRRLAGMKARLRDWQRQHRDPLFANSSKSDSSPR
jgi:arylsulfatase A-like enzyme